MIQKAIIHMAMAALYLILLHYNCVYIVKQNGAEKFNRTSETTGYL